MAELIALDFNILRGYQSELRKRYEEFKARNLKLDMSRGKPSPEQLDLSLGLLDCLGRDDYKTESGVDCRNYGGVEGIPEARRLFAELLEVDPKEIIIGGNSSLAFMHDIIARAIIHGVPGGEQPWGRQPVKFLCPSPGYDRHFAICEYFNIEMVTVEMSENGPDMEQVERLVAADDTIKGIWCVPKYSNPTGITYSDEIVDRLARMKTKAKDFRIFWDNAYAVHHLTDRPDRLKNILPACKEAGNPDRVFIFSSTSKISFAGAGLAMVAGSENNINWLKRHMSIQTIGPDKLNQLRHVRFFRDIYGIEEHMKKHAAIIKPKFDLVLEILQTELEGKNIASWSKPNGGYFISLDTMKGCARKVVAMAAGAGVVLTNAGATFPYGKDPQDRNIRIAPTFPSLGELREAMKVLAVCIQLVSVEKVLEQRSDGS